jgi:DNA-binding MarR family transcriptional regulator
MMPYQSKTFSVRYAANDEDPTPVLHRTVLSLVRRRGADLTARQLGVFLSVYLHDGPHTVRGLAAHLQICKPAVTRALDRLGELGLVRREDDPRDRRSVLAERTDLGSSFMGELRRATDQAAAERGGIKRRAPASTADAWPSPVPANRTTASGHGPSPDAWRG